MRWFNYFMNCNKIDCLHRKHFFSSKWTTCRLAAGHRRRSGWNSEGRMAGAEGGSVPNRVGYGEGCPLCSRLEGLRERRELPQRGSGQSPGRKRILPYFEGHRTLLFVSIWQKSEGTICTSVPYSKFWRDLSPASPMFYAHAACRSPKHFRCHQEKRWE